MSEVETTDAGGTVWDAPNQQVVRQDQSTPWDQGTGGVPGVAAEQAEAETGTSDLDSMTKDQLLEYAQSRGISPANAGMTKDELKASIQEAGG